MMLRSPAAAGGLLLAGSHSPRVASGYANVVDVIEGEYSRARIVKHDRICTRDVTTVIVILDGKVDTLMRGDRMERFLAALQ